MSRPPTTFDYLRPGRGLYLALAGSAIVHAVLVGTVVLGGILRESAASDRESVRITALLRKGKPRPENWLPRKPPEPAPAPPKETRPAPDAKTAPSSPQQRQPPRDYSKEMAAVMDALAREAKSKKAEEAEGSPEGVEEGDALIAQKGNEYMTRIYKAIKAQYAVPQVIPPQERLLLRATVVITIDRQGNLKDFHFEKRSDNPLFDSAIEAAVRRAAPFPPPPQELAKKYADEGIGLEFTP